MQRWIVIGVLAMLLLGAGGGYGLWTYKQNRPDRRWVPLPLNPSLSEEQKKEAADQIRTKILEGDILLRVASDTKLADRLKLGSNEDAAKFLQERLFVEVGTATSPTGMGEVPAINVGMDGKRKEMKALGDASTRLMEDVWKILGIKSPAPPAF